MSSVNLNLIAIGVFSITFLSIAAPLVNISPSLPAGITALILGLGAFDTFLWQNQGSTILSDLFASAQQRQRVIHHEAGHFLVAYYLNIPVKDYTLSAWSAWRNGYSGRGGIVFDLEMLDAKQTKLDDFCTVWLAGIAAERLIYGQAEGGVEDRQKVTIALNTAGINPSQHKQKLNLALIHAKGLIEEHQQSYQILVNAMTQGLSVADCYQLLAQENVGHVG
jgi:hypothetical protein